MHEHTSPSRNRNRNRNVLPLLAFLLLLPTPALAGGAREAQGDAWFDAIMNPQNTLRRGLGSGNAAFDMPVQAAEQAARPSRRSYRPAPAAPAVAPGGAVIPGVTLQTEGPTVEVPLDEYSAVRDRLIALREEAARALGPAVVLGASEFSGRAIKGALSLRVKLQVTLGRPGLWKTVPLIGDDVVLVRAAQEGGARLPVSRRNGYHVWVTRQTGEKTLDLEILVPARGPRGSIEYDFLVARTPVMRFACAFPVPGLEPRLDAAVESDVRSAGGKTLLDASLRPTTHIHLVGFRDLGEDEGQAAKVYSESLNLLSLDEGALDLFTVIRYTILYAGTKEFEILIPEGLDVISADGEGAFRFVLEKQDSGATLLKGETAFPIRNNYEISLQLHREMEKKGESFDVPLPRCLGVERETGWLGVEVPGKLKLEEAARERVAAVDVRQIPPEMVHSAVSPILKAYRYHTTDARVRLTGTRLPEKEPEAGSVDRVRAFTVVSTEGTVLSDVRITLRNRLMHSLALSLPEGTEVRSTHLDGQPVKPSRDEQGRLLLPLKRSTGRDRLRPFTLQLVLESAAEGLGLLGHRELELPGIELPVSSLAWTVYLPARNAYSRLQGDIEHQRYAGQASWHRPLAVPSAGPVGTARWDHGRAAGGAEAAATAGDSGAMPVRIELPRTGTRLEYSRYWIERAHPVAVDFYYVRGWLNIPAWLLLAALYGLCLMLLLRHWTRLSPRLSTALGLGGLVVLYWPLQRVGGSSGVLLGLLLGLVALGLLRRWPGRALAALGEWTRTLGARFRERDKGEALSAGALAWKILCGIGMGVFGLILLVSGLRFLGLLFNPLGG